ncbi:MAG TPA: long-chain fatty acid--CoA ligase [Gemmatimonadales bacterium]|jgi:long-chain acyl-CoA synthetase|nr:long-chain fatty acid--CoA ligase [Gemmatimonadales bacterium]
MRAKRDGRWVALSYTEFAEQVEDFSIGLLELGVSPGDRLAILSENRPEWAIADYACLAARCTDVPIYPTLPARQAEYILRDSGSVAVLVSSAAQLEKLRAVRDRLPAIRHVIALDQAAPERGVLGWSEVLARGQAARLRYPDWRAAALRAAPEDLATIIYTSGTTGDPKGVMLTHGNIASNVSNCVPMFSFSDVDECLSFLPLSHIFERMFGHYSMLHAGVVINYAESIESVPADMQDRRPTVMASVPRLYEKIYGRVLESVRASSLPRQRIFRWARRVGEEWAERAVDGRTIGPGLAFRRGLADRLVFAKLRARTGGRIRFFISGGAPLSADVARFFYAAGMPVLEGYGLTETSPVIAVNTFEHHKLGTVGRPIPGEEVRIAPDGEILARGPNIMRGYFGKPEATAEALDADGWFHTGDIGEIDAEGYLRITDRKKDLIVTAAGKNIAPQPIENLAKTSRYVANAVMLGDRRPFPIMLIVPNEEALRDWCARHGFSDETMEALLGRTEVRGAIEREVRKTLRDLAQFEMPKKFLLMARDFSVESGELTPTLKVRRRIVEERHRSAIETLYAEPHVA